MEEAFTFDLAHFPSSLSNDNDTLRTVTKADLANSLKLTTVSGAEPEKLKIVLDGSLLFYTVPGCCPMLPGICEEAFAWPRIDVHHI